VNEVNRLSEIDADRLALRHVDQELLSATRSKFITS
jgi:hypothetical protein